MFTHDRLVYAETRYEDMLRDAERGLRPRWVPRRPMKSISLLLAALIARMTAR